MPMNAKSITRLLSTTISEVWNFYFLHEDYFHILHFSVIFIFQGCLENRLESSIEEVYVNMNPFFLFYNFCFSVEAFLLSKTAP